MKMNFLDFLSESPNISIFQKENNKTNLGGFFSLIYIIIMIIISFIYIIGYFCNDKYQYSSSFIFNSTLEWITPEMEDDPELNPLLNFTIWINPGFFLIEYLDNNEDNILKNDSYDIENYEGYNVKKRINDFYYEIRYYCEKFNCSELEENVETSYIYIAYNQVKLNHQNNPPLSKENDYSYLEMGIHSRKTYSYIYFWEIIKYKENIGLFDMILDKQTEYTYGHFKDYKKEELFFDVFYDENLEKYYKTIAEIRFKVEPKIYLEFIRKRASFLDVIANIGALFSTIKASFMFFFAFYSKKFDNYKIIEKLLNSNNIRVNRQIELTSNINISTPLIDDNSDILNNDNSNKSFPLMDELSGNKKSNPNDNATENESNENGNVINKNLGKFAFYDFFYNNIYFKCCKRNKNQEKINLCNDIISKYCSIDFIIYNLLKLENLFSDYKWKNPSLNNIKNNESIIKLKNIL